MGINNIEAARIKICDAIGYYISRDEFMYTISKVGDLSCLCGSTMIGDGHTSVRRCEFSEAESVEPDAPPIMCELGKSMKVNNEIYNYGGKQ